MSVNIETIRNKLESLISGPFNNDLGSGLKIYDEQFNEVITDKAEHFVVTVPKNEFTVSINPTSKTITMTLSNGTKINPNEFDTDVKVGEVYKNIKSYVRSIPGMTLNIKTLGRSIVRKDIKSFADSTDKENNVKDVFNESVGRLEGSIKTSTQAFENATLIIKHSNPINEEKRGARARDIKAMYIANASGERFPYPRKHLGGARCLAKHISEGGTHDDMVGESIIGLSENLYKLREFLNITKRQGLVNEANEKIIEGCKKKMHQIKETVKSLQSNKGYAAFVENLSINGSNKERELSEDKFNEYVDRFTVHKFDESLRGVIPLIHTIKEESEAEDMKFTMNRFVETYKKHAEPVVSNTEDFTVYFTPEGMGGKEVDFSAAITNVQSNYTSHKMKPNAKEAFQMGATLTSMANSIRIIEHQGKTQKGLSGSGKVADIISNMLSDAAKLLEGNPAYLKIISKLPTIQQLMSIYHNKENIPDTMESLESKLDTTVENAFGKYDPDYVLLGDEDGRGDLPFGDDEVSSCCGASIDGEPSDGFGRCGECGEMASVVTTEEVSEAPQLDEIFGFMNKRSEAKKAQAKKAQAAADAKMTAGLVGTLHKTTHAINKSENRKKANQSADFHAVGKEHDRLADYHMDAFRKTGDSAHKEAAEEHKEAAEEHHRSAKHGADRIHHGLYTQSHEHLAHTSARAHNASDEAGSDHATPHADRVHNKFWGGSSAVTTEEVSEAPYDSIGELDDFVEGYIDAAAWTEEEELGDAQWSEEGLADMKKDATAFYQEAEDLLSQADNEHGMAGHGHDFWLTRNGHGAGFWDRGYGEVGDQLSELAGNFGEAHIYTGDDGMIYAG